MSATAGARAPHSFLRMFSSAVLSQVLLSAGSFLIGLVLIRHISDLQYGYYILVTNALLLAVVIENALVGPFIVNRAIADDDATHTRFLGDLYAEQRRWLLILVGSAVAATIALRIAGLLATDTTQVVVLALLTSLAVLDREYFRIVLLAHQQSERVLRADIVYVSVVLLGALLSTLTSQPVLCAIAFNGAAAVAGSLMMRRQLRAHRHWKVGDPRGGALRQFAASGVWSVSGAGIHWLFSQSYSYLVTAVLGVAAVTALGATRLLMMPVNLLSTGIRSQMMPVTSRWLQQHGASKVLARLSTVALAMALIVALYFGLMWWARDWIFATVLKKDLVNRDELLLLWSAIFMSMAIRDQLIYLPIAAARFRTLAMMTLLCALVSMLLSYVAMQRYGQVGALIGTLAGELLNLAAIIALCLKQTRHRGPADGHVDSLPGVTLAEGA